MPSNSKSGVAEDHLKVLLVVSINNDNKEDKSDL